MRWPWRRNETSEVAELPKADPAASAQAKREAEEERKRALARNARIEKLGRDLLGHEEENHFSEWILDAMRRRHS